MKVFYDHQAFSLQDYGGVSRIFTELVKRGKAHHLDAHLSLLYSNNVHLKEAGLTQTGPLNNIHIGRRRIIYGINNLYNKIDIRKGNFDLYHPTYYDTELLRLIKNRPVVATYHDLIHERLTSFKELSGDVRLVEQKKLLANKATRIIAVSENTKRDLIEIYGLQASKIKVVHLGNSFSGQHSPESEKDRDPYLLYVGNRGLYKNFSFFLKAVAPLLKKYKIKLVCAGGRAFTADESSMIQNLSVGHLVTYQTASDKVLAQLYSKALAFVFPSLYEGFGIPVLEAFSCGCPCILSKTSSLPEVAGNAAVYMDPNDADSILATVEQVINSSELRASLTARGSKQLLKFSWDKHVAETIELYKDALQ